MNVLIVYAHPSITSFNEAMKNKAIQVLEKNNHEVKLSELYAMKFNAVADWGDFQLFDVPNQYGVAQMKASEQENGFIEDIQLEQEKIKWADLLIFQFPLWWFSVPAILKGWMDRVLAAGFAYDKEHQFKSAPLFGRKALVVVTTQAPESSYQKNGVNGDIHSILYPITHSLHFIGWEVLEPFIAYEITTEDKKYRENHLNLYEQFLGNLDRQ